MFEPGITNYAKSLNSDPSAWLGVAVEIAASPVTRVTTAGPVFLCKSRRVADLDHITGSEIALVVVVFRSEHSSPEEAPSCPCGAHVYLHIL